MVLSRNTRSRGSNMTPKMTSDGKFLCEGDNKAFNTREEYVRRCSQAYAGGSKCW